MHHGARRGARNETSSTNTTDESGEAHRTSRTTAPTTYKHNVIFFTWRWFLDWSHPWNRSMTKSSIYLPVGSSERTNDNYNYKEYLSKPKGGRRRAGDESQIFGRYLSTQSSSKVRVQRQRGYTICRVIVIVRVTRVPLQRRSHAINRSFSSPSALAVQLSLVIMAQMPSSVGIFASYGRLHSSVGRDRSGQRSSEFDLLIVIALLSLRVIAVNDKH